MAKKNEKAHKQKEKKTGESQCPRRAAWRGGGEDARPSTTGPQPAPQPGCRNAPKGTSSTAVGAAGAPRHGQPHRPCPRRQGPLRLAPAPPDRPSGLWGTKPRKQTDAIRRPDGGFTAGGSGGAPWPRR